MFLFFFLILWLQIFKPRHHLSWRASCIVLRNYPIIYINLANILYVCLCLGVGNSEMVNLTSSSLDLQSCLHYLLSANNIHYNYTIFLIFIKTKKKQLSLKCPISFIIIKGLSSSRLSIKSEEIYLFIDSLKCVLALRRFLNILNFYFVWVNFQMMIQPREIFACALLLSSFLCDFGGWFRVKFEYSSCFPPLMMMMTLIFDY